MDGSILAAWGLSGGQGWHQISGVLLAFVLASLIGLERELRHKSAGLRTHTVVGVAAALIVVLAIVRPF